MKNLYSILTVIGLTAVLLSGAIASTPARPATVPQQAVWAGGADGGSWILCDRISKEPWGPVFQCTIYDDYSGSVVARGGLYVVSKKQNGKFQRVERFDGLPRYSFYDGYMLGLEGNSLFLVPHGVVEYPFPNNDGGKRITYDSNGIQVGPERSY
jgi:hypothetical protein